MDRAKTAPMRFPSKGTIKYSVAVTRHSPPLPSCFMPVSAALLLLCVGVIVGRLSTDQILLVSSDLTSTNKMNSKKLPLQVFPLLKELRTGWGNMQVPPLLKRDANKTRALVVDVGLDRGEEFFYAMQNGFEVVGFEPNPGSFKGLAQKCSQIANCEIVDLEKVDLPLRRKPNYSYLINAGAGATRSILSLSLDGAGGSFVSLAGNEQSQKAEVPVVRIDEIISEDVFLFKIDTQGYDHFVLEGARDLFQNHVVRQIIFEVEPYAMSRLGLNIQMTLSMLQGYGMVCFTDRNDNRPCDYMGDSAKGFDENFFDRMKLHSKGAWAKCWEDFLCLNIEKIYESPIPPLL